MFWEFLNASSQYEAQSLFNKLIAHEISISYFLIKTQGSAKAVIYSPMIESAVIFGGKVFGVNLSRDKKATEIFLYIDPKNGLALIFSLKQDGFNVTISPFICEKKIG